MSDTDLPDLTAEQEQMVYLRVQKRDQRAFYYRQLLEDAETRLNVEVLKIAVARNLPACPACSTPYTKAPQDRSRDDEVLELECDACHRTTSINMEKWTRVIDPRTDAEKLQAYLTDCNDFEREFGLSPANIEEAIQTGRIVRRSAGAWVLVTGKEAPIYVEDDVGFNARAYDWLVRWREVVRLWQIVDWT